MGPLANGILCLSKPKHNGKSDTDFKFVFPARNQNKETDSNNTLIHRLLF
jgi:hypothetical protein